MAEITQMTIRTEDLMSFEDAAAALGQHKVTLYRWVKANKMVSVKFAGTSFVPTSEVERLKREQQIAGKQEAPAPRTDAGA